MRALGIKRNQSYPRVHLMSCSRPHVFLCHWRICWVIKDAFLRIRTGAIVKISSGRDKHKKKKKNMVEYNSLDSVLQGNFFNIYNKKKNLSIYPKFTYYEKT